MAAIETCALEKVYLVGFWRKKPRVGLRPLNLVVNKGEVFGYLGPNGAGKTTTLKLLMGLVFPTSGSARILGMPYDDPKVRADIGFLPEQPYFYDYLTAGELLQYYGELSGIPAGERRTRAKEVLARVGIEDAWNLQLRKFSKGMLQRVGIAQAIIHDPKVVFLDEPMSGLDPIGRREVRDLIQTLKDEGKTIFFSTHILSDAEAICDRVAVLHQGELRGIGAVAELTAAVGGRVELLWQGATGMGALAALGGECHVAGDVVRAVLPETQLDQALEALRRARAHLISVTPVRSTLEDYFIQRLGAAPGAAKSAMPGDLAQSASQAADGSSEVGR